MNFLLRSAPTAASVQPPVNDFPVDMDHMSKKPATTLEGLIAEDPCSQRSATEDCDKETDGVGPNAKEELHIIEKHSDVTEDEGWITIPYKELPDDWNTAPDILSFRSFDRSFVFPGEQVHILACLSAKKQDTEIITPFKVAAVMSKNGARGRNQKQNVSNGDETHEACIDSQERDQNDEKIKLTDDDYEPQRDISASESLLRMEDYRRQTESLLQRFKNSHFFVRIANSDAPLWSKRSAGQSTANDEEAKNSEKSSNPASAVIDRGDFDASVSGGVARNSVKCCALPNGDIVVLLQINLGVDFLRDPVLEILQFEKYQDGDLNSEKKDDLALTNPDPCGELLKWLIPLDNTILPPPVRPLSPPTLSSTPNIGNASQKSNSGGPSSSQIFSFGHFRSYSMSSLPQNSTPPPPPPVTNPTSKPAFEVEDWDRFSSQKFVESRKSESEGILSFRGVSMEPERFSVHCGLEGIYIPGRRWRRKLEIIQPLDIRSFPAVCNTDDLLCIQIKNVCPEHTPDIIIFLDSITVIFKEASKEGPPLSLPIACIEAGTDHRLPNLPLRRGEEHSFILKPVTSMWKSTKARGERSLPLPYKNFEGKRSSSITDQYAVLVSCRCNYTESRLFFKQPTSWRPRISRDLMISVASEMSSQQAVGPNGKGSHLPVQVLTLQASNLTEEDLTLTILAPASLTSPPSILSLNSSPSSPMSPFMGLQRLNSVPNASDTQKQSGEDGRRSASFSEQAVSVSDVIPSNSLGCTHLWLQSRVPLGCVPSQSTATIKLELLPLTDGIITLDTLQIDVKEKGITYIPEQSLKINATSSITTGIL